MSYLDPEGLVDVEVVVAALNLGARGTCVSRLALANLPYWMKVLCSNWVSASPNLILKFCLNMLKVLINERQFTPLLHIQNLG